jgi:hypothetical protein
MIPLYLSFKKAIPYLCLLNMGTPKKMPIWKDLIRLSGFEPDVDIQIE